MNRRRLTHAIAAAALAAAAGCDGSREISAEETIPPEQAEEQRQLRERFMQEGQQFQAEYGEDADGAAE